MVSRELPTSNVDMAKVGPGFQHDGPKVQKAGLITFFERGLDKGCIIEERPAQEVLSQPLHLLGPSC